MSVKSMLSAKLEAAREKAAQEAALLEAAAASLPKYGKNDTVEHALEKECAELVAQINRRDSAVIDRNLWKGEFEDTLKELEGMGIFCPQVKARDYSEEESTEASVELTEIIGQLRELMDLEGEIDGETRRAVAFGIVKPIMAEKKAYDSFINKEGELINSAINALKPRVLAIYKGKNRDRVSFAFSDKFPSICTFMEVLVEEQKEAMDRHAIKLQKQEQERKDARAKRAAERREAKRLEAKAVIWDGTQVLETVYEDGKVATPALSFPAIKKDGKKVSYIGMVGEVKKAAQK